MEYTTDKCGSHFLLLHCRSLAECREKSAGTAFCRGKQNKEWSFILLPLACKFIWFPLELVLIKCLESFHYCRSTTMAKKKQILLPTTSFRLIAVVIFACIHVSSVLQELSGVCDMRFALLPYADEQLLKKINWQLIRAKNRTFIHNFLLLLLPLGMAIVLHRASLALICLYLRYLVFSQQSRVRFWKFESFEWNARIVEIMPRYMYAESKIKWRTKKGNV